MESRSCAQCTYAMPIKGSDWVECRRYPPTGASTTNTGFPTSPVNGWCGEYKLHTVKVNITERV
jgi:hypothetical protein